MILGIDGPSLAGKSSLVKVLIQELTRQGVDCVACPSFAEAVDGLGRTLPRAASTPEDHLRAIKFFIEIDKARRPTREPALLVLDGTVWALQARIHALLTTNSWGDVLFEIDTATADAVDDAKPDVLVYLDVPRSVQLQRALVGLTIDRGFLNPDFESAFRSFFNQTATHHQALWLLGTNPVRSNAEAVVDHLRTTHLDLLADNRDAAWVHLGEGQPRST